MTSTAAVLPETAEVSLLIGGMTCGACAARIEKRLNLLEGVEARVNYASERATATFPGLPGYGISSATRSNPATLGMGVLGAWPASAQQPQVPQAALLLFVPVASDAATSTPALRPSA